jgi:hypothetical protein
MPHPKIVQLEAAIWFDCAVTPAGYLVYNLYIHAGRRKYGSGITLIF